MSEWRNYFGISLALSELDVESLEVLASSGEVSPFIEVSCLALTFCILYVFRFDVLHVFRLMLPI